MIGAWPLYLLRRLLQVIPALLLLLTASFVLIHLAPGSPITVLAGDQSSPAYQAELTRRFGLDRPLGVQYLDYLLTLGRGELGRSIVQGRPVGEVIAERIPATLLLIVPAFLLSAGLGLALGAGAALNAGRSWDRILVTLALAGQAVPVFVIGLVLVLIFSVWLGLLPVAGIRDLRETYTGVDAVVDSIRHLLLPVLALALGHIAVTARLTRSGLRDQAAQPYAVVARAKGRSEAGVLAHHLLRNAANPILAALGNEAAILLGGAVLAERIFGWPGLGQLTLDSALSRDYPLLLGIVLLSGVAVAGVNLAVDLISPLIDPRLAAR